MASFALNSLLNTFALPVNFNPSLPVILATAPSSAKLPYKILKCPVSLMGSLKLCMTFCPRFKLLTFSKFSPIVLPVTDKQLPSRYPSFNKNFITPGTPPTLCKSSITYFPLGFKSAKKGVRSLIFWKSLILSFTPTDFAIAIRCKTAFVDPPNTVMRVSAFSKAFRVIISLGFISSFNK